MASFDSGAGAAGISTPTVRFVVRNTFAAAFLTCSAVAFAGISVRNHTVISSASPSLTTSACSSISLRTAGASASGGATFSTFADSFGSSAKSGEQAHNNTSTAKVSIYEQVVVTSPSGKTFTLKPIAGNNYDYLGLVNKAGSTTSGATVRLNGAYLNAVTAAADDHPSTRFSNEFWGAKADWTEQALQAIPAQGNWRFDITLTDAFVAANASLGTTKNFTQYRRAINRAPTLAELKAIKWPAIKDPIKATLGNLPANQTGVSISSADVAALAVVDGWDVSSGAWSPTSAKIYGKTNVGVGWDEAADVASTARKVSIGCKSSGAHCATSPADAGKFLNAGYGYLQFSGRDSKRLQMSLNYSTRKTASDAP